MASPRACDVADQLGADILWAALTDIAFPFGFSAVYPYATRRRVW